MKKILSLLIMLSLIFSLEPMSRDYAYAIIQAQDKLFHEKHRVAVTGHEVSEIIEKLTQGNEKVKEEYTDLYTAIIKSWLHNKISIYDTESIFRVIPFAALKHSQQTRKDKDKTPYIIHPMGVARAIVEYGQEYDATVIQAALLHDTIEDTQTTFEEIEANFGVTIRRFVEEVTEDKKLTRPERKQWWIDTAAQKSPKASLIILADKTCNMLDARTVDWDQKRVDEYFTWCHKVITKLPVEDNHPLKKRALEVIDKHFTNGISDLK